MDHQDQAVWPRAADKGRLFRLPPVTATGSKPLAAPQYAPHQSREPGRPVLSSGGAALAVCAIKGSVGMDVDGFVDAVAGRIGSALAPDWITTGREIAAIAAIPERGHRRPEFDLSAEEIGDASRVPVEAVTSWLQAVSADLQRAREGNRARVSTAFGACLAYGGLTAIALFVGIGLFLAGEVGIGVVAELGALLGGAVSAYLANLYRNETKQFEALTADLRYLERARLAVEVADQITTRARRDEALQAILDQLRLPTP